MRSGPPIAVLALALFAGCSPAPTKDQQQAMRLEQSFVGKFVGTLERRDAASDHRVTLPARMVGKRMSGGGVELAFEYGPAAANPGATAEPVEREVTRLRVFGEGRSIEFTRRDGATAEPVERFRIERFAAFTGLGELIITGSAQEAGAPVDVRILYSVQPGGITWTRDTRPPGGEYKFRQRYTMKRVR